MKPVYVVGWSLWMPDFPNLAAFTANTPSAPVEPPCAWVPSRALRGSSRLTRMFCEVAAQATSEGMRDAATIATVYTSSYGEIETMVQLLEVIFRGDGQLSPMRFKNSVHNAGSGLGSIGQSNTAFSTALAAGPRSFEAGVLEAIALLEERGGDVVVSCADDVIPDPLARLDARASLAVGLALSSDPRGARMRVDELVQGRSVESLPRHAVGRELSAELACNPAAQALPLLTQLVQGRSAEVALAFDVRAPFKLKLATL